jgi:hypothetical protein
MRVKGEDEEGRRMKGSRGRDRKEEVGTHLVGYTGFEISEGTKTKLFNFRMF